MYASLAPMDKKTICLRPYQHFTMTTWEHSIGRNKVVLLVADCPPGLEFGIDCISYETGPKFKGISCIPKGLHFVYYSYGGFQREGVFHTFNADNVYLISWDKQEERFITSKDGHFIVVIHLSEEKQLYLEEEILNGQLNQYLAPYPDKQYQQWISLSCHISDQVLSVCNCPLGGLIVSDGEELSNDINIPNISSSSSKYDLMVGHIPIFSPIQQILSRGWETATEGERTSLALDKSWALEKLLLRYPNTIEDILGEMQLAYLMFLFLQSWGGLKGYKTLLPLFGDCGGYLSSHSDFSVKLLKALYHQLQFLPDDFFEQELSEENFWGESLKGVVTAVLPPLSSSLPASLSLPITPSTPHNPLLSETLYRFRQYVQKKFDLSLPDVDYGGATIVPPSEGEGEMKQREKDTLSEEVKEKWNKIQMCLDEVDIGEISRGVDNTLIEGGQRREDIETSKEGQGEENEMQTDPPSPPQFISLSNNVCERERLMFSWRYPLLCEEMSSMEGREDMLMTAIRVIGKCELIQVDVDEQKLLNEALYFVENESATVR